LIRLAAKAASEDAVNTMLRIVPVWFSTWPQPTWMPAFAGMTMIAIEDNSK